MVAKSAKEKEKTRERRTETQSTTTKVVAVTRDSLFEGTIRHQSRQNLVQVLNNGISISSNRTAKQVVPLNEVNVLHNDGTEEHKRSARLKKAEVLFVLETESGRTAAKSRAKPPSKKVRTEEAILTKVCTSNHDLVGKMAGTTRENWAELTEETESFVSLTDVEITPELPNGAWKTASVAVNRAQVTSLEVPKLEPPTVEMSLVRIIRHSEEAEPESPVDLPDLESHAPEAQVQDV